MSTDCKTKHPDILVHLTSDDATYDVQVWINFIFVLFCFSRSETPSVFDEKRGVQTLKQCRVFVTCFCLLDFSDLASSLPKPCTQHHHTMSPVWKLVLDLDCVSDASPPHAQQSDSASISRLHCLSHTATPIRHSETRHRQYSSAQHKADARSEFRKFSRSPSKPRINEQQPAANTKTKGRSTYTKTRN